MFDKETLKQLIATEWAKAAIDGCYAPPMFHGANLNSLYMTADERSQLNNACVCIQEYLLKISDENGNSSSHFGSKDVLGDEQGIIMDAVQTAYFRRAKLKGYQYGDMYLSNNPNRAVSYASRAVVLGETGFQTLRLYDGIKRMGYKMPPKTKAEESAFELFMEYVEKEDEPVVLMKCGLSTEVLKTETGEKIDEMIPPPSDTTMSFMYPLEIELTEWEKIPIEYTKDISDTVKEITPLLEDVQLRRFSNKTVRLTDADGKAEEGPCIWISKTQYQKIIEAKGLQDIMEAEESVVVQSIFPRSAIYKIECINEWQPSYKSFQCAIDESKK